MTAQELGVRDARTGPSAAAAHSQRRRGPGSRGAGERAGRGEGGGWRGPWGRLRCVPEAAKHNFPPLLPPGPGSCCRPRRHRRCCCCSSRCCSSPGSVVGEPRRPVRAEGGATEGPGAAAGPAWAALPGGKRLCSAVGCASGCRGLWLETFRRAWGEAGEGPGPATAAPAARSPRSRPRRSPRCGLGFGDGAFRPDAECFVRVAPPCLLRGPLLPRLFAEEAESADLMCWG